VMDFTTAVIASVTIFIVVQSVSKFGFFIW
jgi:hypothetical protein